jgi:hypothetical protein
MHFDRTGHIHHNYILSQLVDRLCGLAVKEFLAANPEVPGSIPGATRFSE